MLPEADKTDFAPIEIPRVHNGSWAYVKIFAALIVIGGLVWAAWSGYRPPMLRRDKERAGVRGDRQGRHRCARCGDGIGRERAQHDGP